MVALILWLLGYFLLVEISYAKTGTPKRLILLMWPFVSLWYLGMVIAEDSKKRFNRIRGKL